MEPHEATFEIALLPLSSPSSYHEQQESTGFLFYKTTIGILAENGEFERYQRWKMKSYAFFQIIKIWEIRHDLEVERIKNQKSQRIWDLGSKELWTKV